MKNKYRIKKYDVVNNIWILQENFLLFFWKGIGAGPKEKLEAKIIELSKGDN